MDKTIFATGVFLKAEKVQIKGIEQWRWIAVDFEEPSYMNGKEIEVYNYADSYEELLYKNKTCEKELI